MGNINSSNEFPLKNLVIGFSVLAVVAVAAGITLGFMKPDDLNPLQEWASTNNPNFDTTTH